MSTNWALTVRSTSHVLDEPDAARSFNLQTIPSANYMLPDGHGGLLLASRTHALVTRISRVPFYQVAANSGDPLPDTDTALGGFGQHSTKAEYVLAEDGLYATVSRTEVLQTTCVPPPGTDTCIAPYTAVFHTHAVQFDPETLAEISKVELGVAQAEPQWVRMKFALAGGGIFADGPTSAYAVNASVDASGFAAGGMRHKSSTAFWSGWASSSPALVIGGNAPRAQTLWPSSFGNDQGSNASINPNFGIFAKGHSVALIGHHASIRIVPRNGLYWHSQFPQIFEHADAFGNYFTTIGAGPPPPHDSTASCDSYPLVSGTNRDTDVTNAPTSLERLNYRSADEDRIILNLLQRDINYRDDLIYCWNPDGTMMYNSNRTPRASLRPHLYPCRRSQACRSVCMSVGQSRCRRRNSIRTETNRGCYERTLE